MKRSTFSLLLALALVLTAFAVSSSAQTTTGTWTLYPLQASAYTTNVHPPINPDNTSVFSANKGVVPVQFGLSTSPGPAVLLSITGNVDTADDYSFLSFTPASPLTFADIATLSAVYTFSTGNCHGGALRWSVRVSPTQSVFIYYGDLPNFTDCTTAGPTTNQSGLNLIGMTDLRFDTSQVVGGTFYDSYLGALALVGSMPIVRASLVLDAGWAGDQVLTLGNVQVNNDVFVPESGSTPTCDLPPAGIQVSRAVGTATGTVNEITSIQPNDNNAYFRVVDCKYMYNLAAKQLGAGRYEVRAVINSNALDNPAIFTFK